MKVLVTGASGFLGSWVAQRLSEQGHSVRALVRKSSNKKFLETLANVELAYGAIEEAEKVHEACAGMDAVIHAAGAVKARNEDEFKQTNIEGTRNVVEGAKKHGVKRLVLVSSLEASGPSEDGKPVPLEQSRPITAYGRSKRQAELVALDAAGALDVVILRPTAIYGPRDQEILEAFKAVNHGLLASIAGGKSLGTFIYASDCAEACIRALTAKVPSGSVYFVDDGTGAVDQKTMLGDIARALGKKHLLRTSLPTGALKLVATGVQAFGKLTNRAVMLTPEKANMLLAHWVCSSERTRADLGWEPKVPWSEGVALTARWYKDNDWL